MGMDPVNLPSNSALAGRFAAGNAGAGSLHGPRTLTGMAKFAGEHAPAYAASALMATVAVTARGAASGATAMTTSLASNPAYASLKLPVMPTAIRHALRGAVKAFTGL